MPEKITVPVTTAPYTIEYREVPLPEIGPRDALLKIKYCGVCGSDVHLYEGDLDPNYPMVQGHEILGEILEIGEDAAKKHEVRKGDLVNAEVLIPCGECYYCQTGNYARCMNGRIWGIIPTSVKPVIWGGHGGYLYVPYQARLHKFPKDVNPEAAVLIEPLATGMRACRNGGVTSGTSTVVIGPGTIGLVSVVAAKAHGADPLILVGTRKDRLELGKQLGADYTIQISRDTPAEEVAEKVREIVNEHGLLAEVVLEAAGTASSQKLSLALLRPTGIMMMMGCTAKSDPVVLDTFHDILLNEIRMHGSHLSGWAYEPSVKVIVSGKYPLEKIVTHKFPNSQLARAFEVSGKRIEDAIKVLTYPA